MWQVCEIYGYVPTHKNSSSPLDDSVWGPKTRAYLAQSWNRGIDNTLGALSMVRNGLSTLMSTYLFSEIKSKTHAYTTS